MKFHSLIKFFLVFMCVNFLHAEDLKDSGQEEAVEVVLDFNTILQKVYHSAPSITHAAIEYDVSAAKTLQASLFPNPEFAVYADDIGGGNHEDDRCCSDSEITYSIIQLIESGGKRCARKNFAERNEDIVLWNQEVLKQNLRLQAWEAFISAYAAQEAIDIAVQQMKLREDFLQVVTAKVDAGKVSMTHQNRMEIMVFKAKHALEHAQRAYTISKHQLAALWGDACPAFDRLTFAFYEIFPPPQLCDLLPGLANNADLLKFELEIAAAEDNLALQQANGVPDITLEAGVVDNWDNHETQMSFGFSIPLPFFDRNQGNIAAVDLEVALLENKRDAAQVELEARLNSAHQEWICIFHEVNSVRDQILTKARSSSSLIHEGYRQGKFELMDVLESEQMVGDIEQDFIDTLVEFHRCRAKVERLIGRTIL